MTTTATGRLFTPARLGELELSHRLVMAPLTRNRAAADGTPTGLMATYYAQRATAGLIIAEAATPNPVGQTYPNIPGIHRAEHVAGWRQVTEAVQHGGGRMFLQLQHGGRVGHPDNSGLIPVAPSPIALPETIHTPNGRREAVVPEELTIDEIQRTVADFAAAARNAVAAGFAGVEVHSANGYLLHQFLASNTNRRTDAYGGTVANRIRFTVEVVEAVAAAIGAHRVGLRISPANPVNGIEEDDTADLYPALATVLADRGLAYLHTVRSDPADPLLRRLRDSWPGTLIANPANSGDSRDPAAIVAEAEALLAAGADFIALGRAFLTTPDLVRRLRIGAPLNEIREGRLMYVGGAEGYIDYPALPDIAA
ncbi:alkene reductase [Nocardia carnea]|uniref:Alkene reductase n=1 Tax=Nocardia carnea TaxID=37328 RepID=A0ABW7TPI3_9NOCA|nr:alkene reductase [Nocardia carnea]